MVITVESALLNGKFPIHIIVWNLKTPSAPSINNNLALLETTGAYNYRIKPFLQSLRNGGAVKHTNLLRTDPINPGRPRYQLLDKTPLHTELASPAMMT